MTPIINPCETCTLYKEQAQRYLTAVSKGDLNALYGLRTVFDMALIEAKNSGIERKVQTGDSCDVRGFCIYNTEKMRATANCVDEAIKLVRAKRVQKEPIILFIKPFGGLKL